MCLFERFIYFIFALSLNNSLPARPHTIIQSKCPKDESALKDLVLGYDAYEY